MWRQSVAKSPKKNTSLSLETPLPSENTDLRHHGRISTHQQSILHPSSISSFHPNNGLRIRRNAKPWGQFFAFPHSHIVVGHILWTHIFTSLSSKPPLTPQIRVPNSWLSSNPMPSLTQSKGVPPHSVVLRILSLYEDMNKYIYIYDLDSLVLFYLFHDVVHIIYMTSLNN